MKIEFDGEERWLNVEDYLVQQEFMKMKHKHAMKELEKYYIEKDNQFFLGCIDFINKNER